ncbi:gamma-glutamyltransferase [Variovorax terrae]|uniref:Glutathione hydrolase proenzyme n=1 Tax=Variovorax terrae TaxID=2923278 RepID=A0A9X1VUI0_9BURK|nr:gamma-glutamyltransferase [Variovorax terrae]MCJ0763513.1 gamma-glutamyltransferase [Variovorax terrae]
MMQMIRRAAPMRWKKTMCAGLALTWMLAACGGSGGGSGLAITPGVPLATAGHAGVVAVSHPLAAQVGRDVLAAGGNAVDAAAAIQFALNVVEPQSSGIGGGAFIMVWSAKDKKSYVIDSRERAPAAATPGMFGTLSFEDASTSGISVGVPGTLAGWNTALGKWGTRSLSASLQPAIALADNGFPVGKLLAGDIVNTSDRGFQMTNLQPETAALFRPGGTPLKEGQTLKQPDLAKTLRLIAAQGIDVFYKGEIATAIVQAQSRAATTGAAGAALTTGKAGLMTLADLAAYATAQREPVTGSYRGYGIATMPPPSGGGITVLQQLKMLERFPLGDKSQGFGFGDKNALHVLIEGMRLSFADRNYWEGDADFVKVPVAGLLDAKYLAQRGGLVKLDAALAPSAIVPGNPVAFQPLAAVADPKEGNHTTHFVVADKDGNIVTATTTVESLFGSGIMVPGYGFMLNNELTDFDWPPALNAATGNPGANDVAPFKRPRSSMSPTLLFKGGVPFAALGSAGGSKIINAVVQITSNMIDHGMSVQQALDAPRISARNNDKVFCETGPFTPTGFTPTPAFSASVMQQLDAMRQPAIGVPPCSGNEANGANLAAQALVIDLATGLKYGAADKRREGTVLTVD